MVSGERALSSSSRWVWMLLLGLLAGCGAEDERLDPACLSAVEQLCAGACLCGGGSVCRLDDGRTVTEYADRAACQDDLERRGCSGAAVEFPACAAAAAGVVCVGVALPVPLACGGQADLVSRDASFGADTVVPVVPDDQSCCHYLLDTCANQGCHRCVCDADPTLECCASGENWTDECALRAGRAECAAACGCTARACPEPRPEFGCCLTERIVCFAGDSGLASDCSDGWCGWAHGTYLCSDAPSVDPAGAAPRFCPGSP